MSKPKGISFSVHATATTLTQVPYIVVYDGTKQPFLLESYEYDLKRLNQDRNDDCMLNKGDLVVVGYSVHLEHKEDHFIEYRPNVVILMNRAIPILDDD